MQSFINQFFIISAEYFFVLPVVIGAIYFIKQPKDKMKRLFIFGGITLLLIGALAMIANNTYYNPRPFVVGHFTPLIPHAPDNGFPSDHVLLVSAIASILYVFNKRVGLLLWVIVLLVAIARVYVGVHHPIDVIGSMIISIVATYIIYWLQEYFTGKN